MKRAYLLISGLALVYITSCSTSNEITKENISQNIEFLASDELRGRQTFSPEIKIAEEYIAKEFKQAGLQAFQGNENFLQRFELIELSVKEKKATLNGIEVDNAMVAVMADVENPQWSNDENVIVTYLSAEDDFAEEFGRFRRNNDNLLVIVDPKHQPSFDRYSRWFNRPNRLTELGKGRTLVLIVSSETAVTDYNIAVTTETKKQELNNVVGYIPGNRTDEFVLFSAHHDHIGVRKSKDSEDSVYNGANDDASGTVAVMALAQYFANEPKPERNILFTTFTGEEMGGYGSKFFSKQLDPDQIVAMFNIEMIGKPAVNGPNTAWITGWDRSDFGEILQQSVEGTAYEFYADPYPQQNLFYRSDNATLARLGVPAHSISTTPIDVDTDYHQASDEVKTLDLDHLTNTVKAIAKGAEKIISGELTPTRVDPAEI